MGGLFVMENNVHILIRRAYFDANDKRNSLRGSFFFFQELENCSIMKKNQLTAENANEKNLITGTRYLNVQGMLPFENMAADYVKETGNHVLYRVTPVFEGSNLVASGVLMEAESVEDKGEGILYCVYVYNVQPGININYATGDSSASGTKQTAVTEQATQAVTQAASQHTSTESYILNTNTKKFHRPSCSSVKQMKESNKKSSSESRDALIAAGYDPCKKCNP